MATGEKRILVVEDDNAIRALLFTILRRRGFRVDTASNGAAAIERCSSCSYSLVLLDLMMPVMSGVQFLERLEAQMPARRPLVIVLTAGGTAPNLNPDIVAGIVRKPFDVELLIDTIAACLGTQEEIVQSESCPSPESDTGLTSLPKMPS